jgi:putative ABC transport system ATP-binding protein
MSVISLEDIHFRYHQAIVDTVAVKNLSIQKGERVFIYGPSGSGKSTLLEILAGILKVQSGLVKILDQSLDEMSSHQRDLFRAKNIGYVFQSFNLIPYLNIRENISLPLALQGKKKDEGEFIRLTKHLGIYDLSERRVTDLSVGQQQRVAVARALIGRPQIILADEPTSALDHEHREKFLQLLFSECDRNQTTLLFVSHDRTLEKMFTRAISFQDINQAASR